MTLKGWYGSLLPWVESQVKLGNLKIITDIKGNEFLQGTVLNPHTNIIIEFQ